MAKSASLIARDEEYFRESVGPSANGWLHLQHELSKRAAENEQARRPTPDTLSLLRDFGLFDAVLSEADGGWGSGIWQGRPLALWTINRRIGYADPSIAHCLQLHNNVLDLIFDLAPTQIKERTINAVKGGHIFGAWGASRYESLPWIAKRDGSDAYVVSGTAFFCTNAGFASKALVMAACPEDTDVPYNGLLFGLLDVDQPGVSIEPEWWDQATGMIATASHRVRLTDIRLTRDDIIADGREIKKFAVQTRFMPQFASNFLGMMERIVEEARTYKLRGSKVDDLARVRLGQLALLVLRVETLMRETARIWIEKPELAPFMANAYRSEAGQALIESIDHAGTLLGGGGMLSEFAFAKIVRDALMMLRHENTDKIRATLGTIYLGTEEADVNYSGRQPVEV
jgi:alkylation response protein AidB-like acyl-CoA dehydrogenase